MKCYKNDFFQMLTNKKIYFYYLGLIYCITSSAGWAVIQNISSTDNKTVGFNAVQVRHHLLTAIAVNNSIHQPTQNNSGNCTDAKYWQFLKYLGIYIFVLLRIFVGVKN